MQVGQFLKEKLGNMVRWVMQEVGKENLPTDIEELVDKLGSVEVTYLAEILHENRTTLVHRDWATVVKLIADEPHLPIELAYVIQTIRKRDDMQDKFWRYLLMFSDVVDN